MGCANGVYLYLQYQFSPHSSKIHPHQSPKKTPYVPPFHASSPFSTSLETDFHELSTVDGILWHIILEFEDGTRSKVDSGCRRGDRDVWGWLASQQQQQW